MGNFVIAPLVRGLKHTCPGCGALFYDLQKNPVVCPKCNHICAQPTKTNTGNSTGAPLKSRYKKIQWKT